MKTLIITLEYPPQIGGVASYVYNMASHLPAKDIVVYAPVAEGDNDFDAINTWKVYRRKPYYNFIWPRWLRMLWQVHKIVKDEKIQRIYLHHALPVGYVAYIINLFYKIPYSVFLHGTDVELAGSFKRNKLKRVCRKAVRIYVNSKFLFNKLTNKIVDLDENKIQIIYPCADDMFFSPRPEVEIKKLKSMLALEGKKVILSVGRMDEGKGFPHLIRMMPKIVEKIPNALCLLVGDGPKRDLIEKMIQINNLQNSVRIIGNINHEKLPLFYQCADLFVLLTHKDLHTEEGWGTVFLEAAASAVPVVAGRSGGVEEAVIDNVTGMIVDVYQEKEVISAITELLLKDDFSKKLGEAGLDRVRSEYNWHMQIKKLST